MTAPAPSDADMSLALSFHETYERLAHFYGYKTQIATRQFDPDSPNGRLMIAVCAEIGADWKARIDSLAAQLAERDAEIAEWKERHANLVKSDKDIIADERGLAGRLWHANRALLADGATAPRVERDAARYRWLRVMWWNWGSNNYPPPAKLGGKPFWEHLDAFAAVDAPEKLDAAIDAAVAASAGTDEGGGR